MQNGDGLHKDYKKRHIETETKFYKRMNKRKTFLLTIIIVGIGSLFLYSQYWSIRQSSPIELWLWALIVIILFVAQTLIGYSIFECERKKYIKNVGSGI